MSVNSHFLKVLTGQELNPYPIWMMRQAGRHLPEYLAVRETCRDFIDFCLTPEKAAEVTLQPIRRYDMDAAILFADILLIPLAMGRRVEFIKGTGPVLDPITVKDIEKLKVDGVADQLSPVYETVSRVRKDLPTEKALIGFCGGPWTVATYMLEGRGTPKKEVAKRFAYEHGFYCDVLLQKLADASADYLIEQARAGADALKIFESWAEGLSPELFERLVIRPTWHIIQKVRAAGIETPIIGFPRGAGLNALDYVKALDVSALAVGTDVHLPKFRKMLPRALPLQGNLDPLALRIGGDTLREAVSRLLDDIDGPHIFNLGHGVTPDVKPENVLAVVNHVRGKEAHYV